MWIVHIGGVLPPPRHITLCATSRGRLLKPGIRLSLMRYPYLTVFFLLQKKIEIDL